MKVVIKATAPTGYQLQSLRAFGLNVKQNGNGSYTGTEEFDSIVDARKYLAIRAERYYDVEKELREAKRDIKLNYLTLDAVTAHIEKANG